MRQRNNSRQVNGHPGTNAHANGTGERPRTTNGKATKDEERIPPGEAPLPLSASDFVDEIHCRVDVLKVWLSLLQSGDMKIRQRAAEKLMELRFKGAAALEDEPQRIVIDIDSAVGRRAAEGANA